ncbi:MAG: SDR family NAD(P)-dependent oxidoreductase [Pirellulaceae bacterium]
MFTIDLTGKTAIVTGSSQGLGLATAKCLHAAGANVVINYFPDSAGKHARQAAEAVAALGKEPWLHRQMFAAPTIRLRW